MDRKPGDEYEYMMALLEDQLSWMEEEQLTEYLYWKSVDETNMLELYQSSSSLEDIEVYKEHLDAINDFKIKHNI
jgi:hypothetical protein